MAEGQDSDWLPMSSRRFAMGALKISSERRLCWSPGS